MRHRIVEAAITKAVCQPPGPEQPTHLFRHRAHQVNRGPRSRPVAMQLGEHVHDHRKCGFGVDRTATKQSPVINTTIKGIA